MTHDDFEWKKIKTENVICGAGIAGIKKTIKIVNDNDILGKFDEQIVLVFNKSKPKWMPFFVWRWLLKKVLSVTWETN